MIYNRKLTGKAGRDARLLGAALIFTALVASMVTSAIESGGNARTNERLRAQLSTVEGQRDKAMKQTDEMVANFNRLNDSFNRLKTAFDSLSGSFKDVVSQRDRALDAALSSQRSFNKLLTQATQILHPQEPPRPTPLIVAGPGVTYGDKVQ